MNQVAEMTEVTATAAVLEICFVLSVCIDRRVEAVVLGSRLRASVLFTSGANRTEIRLAWARRMVQPP